VCAETDQAEEICGLNSLKEKEEEEDRDCCLENQVRLCTNVIFFPVTKCLLPYSSIKPITTLTGLVVKSGSSPRGFSSASSTPPPSSVLLLKIRRGTQEAFATFPTVGGSSPPSFLIPHSTTCATASIRSSGDVVRAPLTSPSPDPVVMLADLVVVGKIQSGP
jgi:hypothetical protein